MTNQNICTTSKFLDTKTCLQKINDRGGTTINWVLIKELKRKLLNLESQKSNQVYTTTNLTPLVNSIPSELIEEKNIHILVTLLCICHPLQTYGIDCVDISVLLYTFRPRLLRNLYRHYYVKWKESEIHFKDLEMNLYIFEINPREFCLLDETEMYTAWFKFIESFINHGKAYALFFVCNLHTYMIPFN